MLKCLLFISFQCSAINKAACDLATGVANEGNALVLGGVCQTPTYLTGKGKEAVQAEFKIQADAFVEMKTDFLLAEVTALTKICLVFMC